MDYNYRPEVFRLRLILCEVEHALRKNNLTEMIQYMTAKDNMNHLMQSLYINKSEQALASKGLFITMSFPRSANSLHRKN